MDQGVTGPSDESGRPGAHSGADLARVALRAAKEDARWRNGSGMQRRRSARRPGRSGPVSLRSAVLELLGEVGIAADSMVMFARWSEIVPGLAQNLRPVEYDPATKALTVRPVSAAWGTQARLIGSKLISRLNEHLGSETVTVLRVLAHGSVEDRPLHLAVRPTVGSQVAPEMRTAVERQTRQTPREPLHHFPPAQGMTSHGEPGTLPSTSSVHTRALLRARSKRQSSTESR